MTAWLWCILGAYLIGSIPFGLLIGLARGVDVRRQGSKNIGATNVGRLLGRKFGLLCFVLDALKGAIPVLLAAWINHALHRDLAHVPREAIWPWLGVAAATVLGHMFPIYLGFRGGKGISTTAGSMAAMWPLLTIPLLLAVVVWYLVLRLSRFMSLAGICASISLPIWYVLWIVLFTGSLAEFRALSPPLIVTAILAVMVIVKHRSNIGRIRRGEEPKVGGSARRGDVFGTS